MNNDKLDKIDKLLNDEIVLQNYINKIEENKIDIPSNLNEKILSKIYRKKKVLYMDICKIAACLVFSLVICRTDFIKNDNISKYKSERPKTTISINEKLSDFCKWFTTPLEIDKEEK